MQPEIIDYVIVSEYRAEVAQKRIKALMHIGLQPYGSPSVYISAFIRIRTSNGKI